MGQVIELVSNHVWRQNAEPTMVDVPKSCAVHGAMLMQKEAGSVRSELCWSHFHDAIVKGEVTRCRDMLTSTTCHTDACLGILSPCQRLQHLDSIAFSKLRTTSLHMAALYRRADLVKLLLEQGCEPTVMDGFGRVPAAVLLEHWPRVTFPPDPRGHDPRISTAHPAAPTSVALHQDRPHSSDTILQLWAGRADLAADLQCPEATGCGGDREMELFRRQVVRWRASSALCLKLLLDYGLRLNDVADRRRASTLLHIAARYDLVDVIDLVLEVGARDAAASCSPDERLPGGRGRGGGGGRCCDDCQAGSVDHVDDVRDAGGESRGRILQQREEESPVAGRSPGALTLPGRVKRALMRHVRLAADRSQELCLHGWEASPCRKNRLFVQPRHRSAPRGIDVQPHSAHESMDRGEPSTAATKLTPQKEDEESDTDIEEEHSQSADGEISGGSKESKQKSTTKRKDVVCGGRYGENFERDTDERGICSEAHSSVLGEPAAIKCRGKEEKADNSGSSCAKVQGTKGAVTKTGSPVRKSIKERTEVATPGGHGAANVVQNQGGRKEQNSASVVRTNSGSLREDTGEGHCTSREAQTNGGHYTAGTVPPQKVSKDQTHRNGERHSSARIGQINGDCEEHRNAKGVRNRSKVGAEEATAGRPSTAGTRLWEVSRNPVDLEVRNATAKTPLAVALDRGSLHAAHCLLAHGADIFAVDFYGRSILHFLSERDCSFDLFLRDVVRQGLDVHAADNGGNTPLHVAAYLGNASKVRFLLGVGASPDRANLAGKTPLFLSFHRRDPSAREIILLFLLASVTLRTRDKMDRAPVLLQREQNGGIQRELDRLLWTCNSLQRHCVVAVRRAVGLSLLLTVADLSSLPCPAFLQRVIYGADERMIVDRLCI